VDSPEIEKLVKLFTNTKLCKDMRMYKPFQHTGGVENLLPHYMCLFARTKRALAGHTVENNSECRVERGKESLKHEK
jgi:hypothetical protein